MFPTFAPTCPAHRPVCKLACWKENSLKRSSAAAGIIGDNREEEGKKGINCWDFVLFKTKQVYYLGTALLVA